MEEAAVLPVQPLALVVVDVSKEVDSEPSPLPLPRFSTFSSAARGAAAANPRREERMTVERMAMRTCEDLLGGVVVLTM